MQLTRLNENCIWKHPSVFSHEIGFVFMIIHDITKSIQFVLFKCMLYTIKNKPIIEDEKTAFIEHITLLSHCPFINVIKSDQNLVSPT